MILKILTQALYDVHSSLPIRQKKLSFKLIQLNINKSFLLALFLIIFFIFENDKKGNFFFTN